MPFTPPEIAAFADLGLESEDFAMATFPKILKDRYRALALESHPDKNPGDPHATQIYQQYLASYMLLLELYQQKGIPSGPFQPQPTSNAHPTKSFYQFGRQHNTNDGEENATPNTFPTLPEAGLRTRWENLLVTVEVNGSACKYQEALELCKWELYCPIVVRKFFEQFHSQGIPLSSALQNAAGNVTLVSLTETGAGKPMFFHALFLTISEFEQRKQPGLGSSISDHYYAITHGSTLEFGIGWLKFLLSIGIPDKEVYGAMCGSRSSFGFRGDAIDLYREVLWHCLVQSRTGVFGYIVARLLLTAPLSSAKVPLFSEMAAQGNRQAWNQKWRDTIKKESEKRNKRTGKATVLLCVQGTHEILASHAGLHLENEHKELVFAGWKRCELDSRCVYDSRDEKFCHELCCPYRTRLVLDFLEDSDMRKPEQEPVGTIPWKFRRL